MDVTSAVSMIPAEVLLPPRPLVLFDAECPLCRSLAEWGRRRAGAELEFVAWQEFRQGDAAAVLLGAEALSMPANALRVYRDGRIFEGEAAWTEVLAAHPDLKSLQWVAEKLGVVRGASRVLAAGGYVARRFCIPCRS